MIKIDLTKTYGDDDYKVSYERKGNILIQTCDDDGDIDTYKIEINNNDIIIENENVIIMKHNSSLKDSSEYEFIACDDVNQELEIAQKNI
jgi:hypothetical protein